MPRSRRLSPHTIRSYKTALNALLTYLREARGLDLAQVSFDAIDRTTISGFSAWLLDTQHLSASTANQRLAAIKSFLSYCAQEDPALVAIWLSIKQVRPARAPDSKPAAACVTRQSSCSSSIPPLASKRPLT